MDTNPIQGQQQEIYKLVRENNKMLHAMRRNAFWGGIIKFLLYTGLFIVLPFWLYMTYLAPMLQSTMQAVNQIQGTGAKAQAQFGSFQEMLKQFETMFPKIGKTNQ
ncbi:MAG: hypothetical protein Q7S50_01525 [bacterium]|nr:hypothetical protein [bacterium]